MPDITGVVGRNDVGKSTLMEALEIFFNNHAVKCDGGDLSVGATIKTIKIGCVFDELPASVVVDDTVDTTFADEYLVNSEGDLEIVKTFKCGTKVGSAEVTLRALHPTAEGVENLLALKIDELKALGAKVGVVSGIADARKNSLWRAAIWKSVPDLKLAHREIDVSKLDSKTKSIYEKIQTVLPTFALFKSDRESSDEDGEAKDPMQAAVKQALDEFQALVSEIQETVSAQVIEVADRTLGKLREMDSSLADSLKPVFRDKPKWTFNFGLESDNGIPVNKRGSGVSRLILLNFFRAEAERKAAGHNVIYAVEEPETSQHPNNQEMLMRALLELSGRSGVQVLVTTHVPALAGLLPIDSVLFIQKVNGAPTVAVGSEEVFADIVETLGILPQRELAGAKAIVLVEGRGDIVFLRHTARTLKAHGSISHDFDDKKIVPIPTGGCNNLNHWVTMKTADEIGLPWGALLDSDDDGTNPECAQKNAAVVAQLVASGKTARLTRKRETENYLAVSVIHADCGTAATAASTYTDRCDAKKIINAATSVRSTHVLEKYWPLMTASDMLAMDMYTDCDGKQCHELVEIVQEFTTLC